MLFSAWCEPWEEEQVANRQVCKFSLQKTSQAGTSDTGCDPIMADSGSPKRWLQGETDQETGLKSKGPFFSLSRGCQYPWGNPNHCSFRIQGSAKLKPDLKLLPTQYPSRPPEQLKSGASAVLQTNWPVDCLWRCKSNCSGFIRLSAPPDLDPLSRGCTPTAISGEQAHTEAVLHPSDEDLAVPSCERQMFSSLIVEDSNLQTTE